jgi:hypothetical protein
VKAQLTRHLVAWAKGGQVVGGREITLSDANFIKTDTSQEGLAVSYFELTLGESGKEQSWGISGVLEVAVSLLGFPCLPKPTEAWPVSISFESRFAVWKVQRILYRHIDTSHGLEWRVNRGVVVNVSYVSLEGSRHLRLELAIPG